MQFWILPHNFKELHQGIAISVNWIDDDTVKEHIGRKAYEVGFILIGTHKGI